MSREFDSVVRKIHGQRFGEFLLRRLAMVLLVVVLVALWVVLS